MEKFTVALVSCSVTMTVVALIYSLLSRWLKNVQSSKWRYYVWIFIFIGFIMIYKPSFGESALTVNVDGAAVNDFTVGESNFVPFFGHEYHMIFAIWLMGFLFNLCYISVKQHLFFKSIKRLSKSAPKSISQSAKKIALDLDITASFKVVTVREISSPMITGFRKSLLILPERQFSESELQLILKHELIHLKRHDIFIKAFMLFCGAVHWFNPFIRRFIRSAEQESELYCDETVTEDEDEELKKLYCQSILNTASAKAKEKHFLYPAISSNFSFNKHGLKHRMAMILSFDKKYKLSIIGVLILALTLFTGTVVAFSDIRDYNDEGVSTTTFAATFAVVTNSMETEISSAYADTGDYIGDYTEITEVSSVFNQIPF